MKSKLAPNRAQPVPLLPLLMVILVLAASVATRGHAATFSNTSRILIPASGPGSIYPSEISVSNLLGVVSSVSVILPAISHSNPDDIDLMLVGPGPYGPTNIMLISDAGGTNNLVNTRLGFSNVVTATASPYPPDSQLISSGTYRPSNYVLTSDVFPNTAWSAPFNTNLSAFNGANPNGPWRLFVVDDLANNDGGLIAVGWQLHIETVVYPPVIVNQPDSRTVDFGKPVSFTVGVTGSPPFQYQWYKDGSVLIPYGQGGPTLNLDNVDACDVGDYRVFVRNSAATVASAIARLDVRGPLILCEQPQILRPKIGEDVELRASASGDPPLRYQWTLNGMILTNETSATLLLKDVQAFSGGEFAVIIWNGSEAITKTIAVVAVRASTDGSPTDDFEDRPARQDFAGVLQGNNEKATTQPGEPVTLGGGRTVWFEWIAPDNGIVTLSARGSAFDTLLAVFRGTKVEQLTRVTRDDDRAGFYTSTLQFNAQRGTVYQIQLDGFGRDGRSGNTGAGGEFTISYSLQISEELVPVIVLEPQPIAVQPGKPARFRVAVDSQDVEYQWFFEGRLLEGETTDTLTIPEATSKHVGFYWVRLRQFRRELTSFPVDLQLSSVPGVLVQDKFERLYFSRGSGGLSGGAAPMGGLFSPASGGGPDAGFISIGFGNSFLHEVSSVANNQKGDPNPCGSPFFGTLWEGFSATNTGKILVDTSDSTILARLAVYRITGDATDFTTPPIYCDLTNAPLGKACQAVFDATNGFDYTVVVEGYQASGTLSVTTTMGFAPSTPWIVQHHMIPQHGVVELPSPGSNWFPRPVCQWYFEGSPLLNETNQTLLITDFSESQAGSYSVWMSNFVGAATIEVANVSLAPDFTLQQTWTTNGGIIGFSIIASNYAPFVLEASTNLTDPWLPIATNIVPWSLLLYTNTTPFSSPQRYFRAVPWSP